jgi:hypothetical protein
LQPRRQRRRGCRQISLLCLYTLLIAIGLLAHSVHGQRAAVNLSQKIQNRFAKSAGRGNIVEGENKPTRTDKIGKTSRWFHIAGLREPEIPVNPPNLIATIVLAAMILAALGIYLPQSMKRDLRVGVRDGESVTFDLPPMHLWTIALLHHYLYPEVALELSRDTCKTTAYTAFVYK